MVASMKPLTTNVTPTGLHVSQATNNRRAVSFPGRWFTMVKVFVSIPHHGQAFLSILRSDTGSPRIPKYKYNEEIRKVHRFI